MKNLLLNLSKLTIIVSLLMQVSGSIAQGNWELVFNETSELGNIKGIDFVAGDDGLWETGYACMFDGRILKTTDGGANWTELAEILPEYIWGLSFADENTGYLAGQAGSVFKTTDGGTTWTTVFSNANYSFNKVAFKDANNGVAVGLPNHIYTSDGGTTWEDGSGGGNYWGLDYAAGDTYYGVEAFSGEIGRTTDNGQTWSEAHNSGFDLTICVRFLDENYGIVGGNGLQITMTDDGGDTWTDQELGDGFGEILAVDWFDQDTLWASGVGIYKSTNGGESWDLDTTMWDDGIANREMRVTGMNVVFVSGDNLGSQTRQIWRKVGPPPLGAGFEADFVDVCAGGTVNFTDLSFGPIDSWYWEFEGGTPATSTEQNPTVTYSTPGIYDVKQVVSIGVLQDSLIKTDYINVVELPGQADVPSGATEICTDQFEPYTTNEVLYAADYEWELSPSEAGILTWEMNEANLATADDWTGNFTIRVRALNVCGNGDWSDELEGTIYQSPELFNVEGGGGYCLDGDGVEITLSGSQSEVEYELYLDGISTGNTIGGTGSEISFGFITEEGFYTVMASNENCSVEMAEQVEVFILFPPLEPAQPTGPEAVCDEPSSTYESEGSGDAETYVWSLAPEEAGSISGDGLEATVLWNSEFAGIATVSLAGINDCGEGSYSEVLEVAVGATIPEIIGEDLVCDFSDEVYEVTENEGSTYTWTVSGGTITDGQGTYMITVAWDGEGSGSITVDEENENGCEGSSEEFEVVIDDCTGINENDGEINFCVFPNPANNLLSVNFVAQSDFGSRVMIYNQMGQLIVDHELKGQKGQHNVNFDISNFRSGLFFIKLHLADGIIMTKQIVKK